MGPSVTHFALEPTLIVQCATVCPFYGFSDQVSLVQGFPSTTPATPPAAISAFYFYRRTLLVAVQKEAAGTALPQHASALRSRIWPSTHPSGSLDRYALGSLRPCL